MLGALRNELVGQVILPVSELNRLRRELVQKLPLCSREPARGPVKTTQIIINREQARGYSAEKKPRLVALCRTMEQLAAALEVGCSTVYADFEDVRQYADAVTLARNRAEIFLATPRILKPGEQGLLKTVSQGDGILVRNLGSVERPGRRVGDYSLNVSNALSAELLIRSGLERVAVSYDLNGEQVLSLLRSAPPEWFEVVIHQHLPMFHMDHCLFAAFLSNGTDASNCGRPCDRHKVEFRDRVGPRHPVQADVGCRNTVFHAKAQSGAEWLAKFVEAGARTFRVELLDESREQAHLTLESYRDLMAGRLSVAELNRRLRVVNQLGVTSGTLTVLG